MREKVLIESESERSYLNLQMDVKDLCTMKS